MDNRKYEISYQKEMAAAWCQPGISGGLEVSVTQTNDTMTNDTMTQWHTKLWHNYTMTNGHMDTDTQGLKIVRSKFIMDNNIIIQNRALDCK